MEYIYIIRLREFKNQNLDIYKIGRSGQVNCQRTVSYPKNSDLICITSVDNCSLAEAKLKAIFKKNFKQIRDCGIEYFEGDVDEMKKIFNNLDSYDSDCNLIEDNESEDDKSENDKSEDDKSKNNKSEDKETKEKGKTHHCKICNYSTKRAFNYETHMGSLKHAKLAKSEHVPNNIRFKCEFCKKVFINKSNKARHYSICKVKKEHDLKEAMASIREEQKCKRMETEIKMLRQELKIVKLELDKIKKEHSLCSKKD